VLIDFGIACVPDSKHAAGPGIVVGTLEYMAPEQIAADKVTPAADVYALGVVLFEWLTGVRPLLYSSRDLDTARSESAGRPRFSVASLRPNLDPALVTLVERMLAVKPRKRPAAVEVVDALGGVLERLA
jgi:serine/threonine-protein kinase